MIRGELAMRRISRHKLVYGRSVWILTMMQSCASAAKLRTAGPFSPSASMPRLLPVPATSDRQSAVRPERQRERRIGKEMLLPGALSGCRTQDDALQCLASRDKAPERDQQLACQSLPLRRQGATIIVLRVPTRLSAVRAWYHNVSALCF